MKPRNFISGLTLFIATMAFTYVGASLGEQSTYRSASMTTEHSATLVVQTYSP